MSTIDCCLPGRDTETLVQDNLIGCQGIKTQPWILEAGAYARGDVLYKTAVSGVLTNKVITAGAIDGDAVAIMPFTVTTVATDKMAVYVGGEFNEDEVIGYDVIADVTEALSLVSVLLRSFGN